MRIGIVSPYSLSQPGGVQTHVLGLGAELRRRGHSVRVLAPCDGPPPAEWVDSAGPSVAVPANGSVAPIAVDPRAWQRAAAWPGRRRLDVVHVHEPFSPLVSLAVTATSTVPLVGTFHAAAERWWPYEYLGPVMRRAARRLSAATAVSDAAEALAARHFPAFYHRTPNGLDTDRFRDAPAAAGTPPVLFVGRLEPRKGAGIMVEAARSIPAEVGIVGDGPLGPGLRTSAPANVRFLGSQSGTAHAGLLAGARVACAPSLGGESFGFVVLEAMAAGCAVVASDIPGYRALVGDAGVLVPPGDAAALAAAVGRLLEDGGGWGERARERAEEFSWRRLAGRVEEIYASVI